MKKVRQEEINFTNINKFFHNAVKKFYKAKKVLLFDEETAYQMFYESMLKASLALMLSYGTRPRSLPGHHIVIIEYTTNKLGKKYLETMNLFDRMRRKRNKMIYEADIGITKTEAITALKITEEYLTIIRNHINKNNPQLKLNFKH
jgi:uncharacterized protein (UPF0332 family)